MHPLTQSFNTISFILNWLNKRKTLPRRNQVRFDLNSPHIYFQLNWVLYVNRTKYRCVFYYFKFSIIIRRKKTKTTMNDDEIKLVLILIILIVLLVAKQLYDLYIKFTKSHHEVYFVMGETNCCNPHENPGSNNNRCKKYCPAKLLMKIRNRISSSKSSICIAMYNFSNRLFADYLLSAHRRGVKIRLLVDKSACENPENKTQAKRLKNAGNIFSYFIFHLI